MPTMIEAMSEPVTAAYVKSLEERIKVLEDKLAAPPVDENHKDLVSPIEVVDRSIRIEDANPVTLNDSRTYKSPVWEKPKLDLADVLKPDDSQPKLPLGGAGLNMD